MKLDEELLRKKKLEQQLEVIQAEIQEITQRQKKPAIQTMVETMLELSIEPQEVLNAYRQATGKGPSSGSSRRTLGPAPAKYRNPETGQTWSGRGKAPRWLTEAEAEGKSRDEFLIQE